MPKKPIIKKKLPPSSDIGPAYQFIAAVLLAVGLGLIVLHAIQKRDLTWIDFGVFVVIALLFLALVRPAGFDNVIKSVADKIPFINYKKIK